MDTEPVAWSGELEAVVLAALSKRVKDRQDQVKAIIGQGYGDGDKRAIRSPLGDKLGSIWRTDPDPVWRVVDREALHAHLRQDAGNVETVYDLTLPNGQTVTLTADTELCTILLDHAPHLLAIIDRVTDAAVSTALAHAIAGRDIPGIARVKPAGTLTVRPDKNAGTAIDRLVDARLITWDGRPVLEAAS